MSLPNQVIESFNNASGVALARGMIVRATAGVRRTLLAQADTLGNLASILGVANNATGSGGFYYAATAGEAACLLETGLAPAAGQMVYVSATVAGRGTTVAPTLAVPVGTITDTSRYAVYGTVTISLFAFFSTNATSTANWNDVRYFFVDNENGNDANIGYIDAPALTVFTPAQTGPVALKTEEELRNRIPREGNSRVCVGLLKPRSDAGNYLNKAGANDYLDVNYDGYRAFYFRGSDLTNSTNDQVDLGGVIDVAGPNVDGSWTATGTAGFTITNLAGVLPAENSTTGRKFQFKGNVTAALRTKGNMCQARLSNTTLDVMDNSTVPANGDDYFLMYPGVKFTTLIGPAGRTGTQNSRPRGVNLAGLRFTSNVLVSWPIPPTPVFLRFDGALTWIANQRTTFTTSYTVEDLTTSRTISHCFDAAAANSAILGPPEMFGIGMAFHSSAFIGGGLLAGIYANGLLTIQPSPGPVAATNNGSIVAVGSGGQGNIRSMRLNAGMTMNGDLRVDGVDLSGSSGAGITVTGRSNISFFNITGALSGGDISVIDLSVAISSRVVIGTGMTATPSGAGFEVVLAGPVGTTFASFATTNVVDSAGNDTQGSGTVGHVVDTCKQVINKTGVTLSVGAIVRGNGTSNQVTSAFGNDAAVENSNVLGVMVTPALDNGNGYMAPAGTPVCNFDGAPTMGAIAYLSPTTTRTLTTTVPAVAANNNRLRVGRVIQAVGAGTDARVAWHPENLAVVAPGTP